MAGHKDLKTTMRYVHVLGREIEDVGQVHGLSIQESSSKKLKVVS
jgi:site-specific recombinase XerD